MKLKLVWLALCGALLAGCATIPQSGNIAIGPDVTSGLNNDEVYYSQSGPYQGAPQDAILYGFLSAGNGPQNDYAVAREYLSKDLASKWQPNESVLIQEGTPQIFRLNDHTFRVKVQVSAQIDGDGKYLNLPVGTMRTFDVGLEKVAGQWRISSAPNQTIVVRANFKVLFRAYSVFFFDPSLTYLVPDVRWFPSRASTGTRLMNALLKGPSDWLRPAVVEVIPLGTRLNINAVTIEDGVAQVDLSAAALKVTAARRSLMKAEIFATLGQVNDVTSVEISIQRTPQTIDSFSTGQAPAMGSYPIALTASGLYTLNSGGVQAITGSEARVAALHPTDFAYSPSAASLALVTPSGVYLSGLEALGETDRIVDSRSKQLTPVFDPQGALWTLPAVAHAPFVVTGTRRIVLANPWIQGVPLSFSVSPEGARVAIVYKTDKGDTLGVFPIERNKAGEVVSLGAPFVIPETPATMLSVSWSSLTTVAVLTKQPSIGYVPMFFTVGGEQAAGAAITDAKSMSVSEGGEIYLLQSNGNVVDSIGSSWQTIAQAVLAMHVVID